MSTFRTAFAGHRDTVPQLRLRLANEPKHAASAVRIAVTFLRQLQNSSVFFRFVARRLVRSTITVQRFVRATVLRMATVVQRTVERWQRADERAGLRTAVTPQLRHTIVRAEYEQQRYEFRLRFRAWLSTYNNTLAQYHLAVDDKNRRAASSAPSTARDRAAVLALRLTQLQTKRPRFRFSADESALVGKVECFVRRETATKLERVMTGLGIESNDPDFVSRLVDRYSAAVERERARVAGLDQPTVGGKRRASGLHQSARLPGSASPRTPVTEASDPQAVARKTAMRRPLGAIVSALSFNALTRARIAPPAPQPTLATTHRSHPASPQTARSAAASPGGGKPPASVRAQPRGSTTFLTGTDLEAPMNDDFGGVNLSVGAPAVDEHGRGSSARGRDDPLRTLELLGIDPQEVMAGTDEHVGRPPPAPQSAAAKALIPCVPKRNARAKPERSRTLPTVNPSPYFPAQDTTPPSLRQMMHDEVAMSTRRQAPPPQPPKLVNRASKARMDASRRKVVESDDVPPVMGSPLPPATEPPAACEAAASFVYPGFSHPVVTPHATSSEDAEAQQQHLETQAIMKLPGAWTDGRRAFYSTTHLMLSGVSLGGLARFHQVSARRDTHSVGEASGPETGGFRSHRRAAGKGAGSAAVERLIALGGNGAAGQPAVAAAAPILEWEAALSCPTCCLLIPSSAAPGGPSTTIVVGGINGDVTMYDPHGSRTQLLHHQDRVTCLCVADRGRVLVSGGDDGEVLVHHFAASAPSPPGRGGPTAAAVAGRWEPAVAFKQDSWITAMAAVTPSWVAAAGYENAVYIYDVVDTLAIVRRFAGHTQYVTDMCPFEGCQLATASLDGTVRVWRCQVQAASEPAKGGTATSDLRAQQSHSAFESRVYGEAKGAVVGVQWTQDNLLLAASLDLSVYLVDGVTMQTMATVKLPAATFGTGVPLARALGPSVILVSSTGSRVLQGVNVFNGRMLFEIALPPSAGEVAVVSVLPQGLAIVGTSNGFAFVVDTTLGVLCGAIGSQERAKVSSAVVAVEAASRAVIGSALGYQAQDTALTQHAYVVQDARLVRKVSLADLRAVATEHAAAVEQHEAATAAITTAATAPLRPEKV